jgi:phytoene dehydrogenase-like protein
VEVDAMTIRCDVAVVGGGVAGLSAAAVAARGGSRVVLVEGGPLGGRARTTEHHGFQLNQGPHALYLGGAFQRLLTSLGIVRTGGPPALTRARAWTDGRSHTLPFGPATLARSRALTARGKVAAARVMARLDRLDSSDLAGVSVDEWLTAERVPPDAAGLVRMLIRLSSYAHAPDRLSAGAALGQLRLASRGVVYLDRGFEQLVDGLAAAARTGGATVHQGWMVTAVHREGPSWIVATTRGDIAAPALVLAAGGPHTDARLLGEDPAGWVDQAGPPVEATCLDLGLRRPPDAPILLGMDEPMYLSTHAPPAALAPDGHALVAVMRYLAPGEALAADEAQRLLRAHAARAGVRDGDVVVERYLHRMTVAHGMPLAVSGGLHGRPAVTVENRGGLFVAGDWVGPTGMLSDAAAASGVAAAAAAQAHVARVAA